jgi:hypothetical protein
MEMICDSAQMAALEVNRTADLAAELVMSVLGKRIL